MHFSILTVGFTALATALPTNPLGHTGGDPPQVGVTPRSLQVGATPEPLEVGVTPRAVKDACWVQDNKLFCHQPSHVRRDSGLTALVERTPVTECTLNKQSVSCSSLHKRAELTERGVKPSCTLQNGNKVACKLDRRSVEIEEREAKNCVLNKNGVACGSHGLKERDAEAEPEPVPICLVGQPCGVRVGNSHFYAMAEEGDESVTGENDEEHI